MRFLPFFMLIFACTQTKPEQMPVVSAIKNDQLLLADGSTLSIPHWNDPSYVVIFMVRHGERLMDGTKNPDLTAEGQARAERLGRLMAETELDSVFSTPFRRTQQTAAPVQRRTKSPETITYLPEALVEILESLVEKARGKHILMVGHQNTVPMALNYLRGDFEFRNIPDFEFGRLYIAVSNGIGSTEVIELTY